MSFVHLDYVGHFAPDDPIILSKPFRPKPTRPIEIEAVHQLIEQTGGGIERLVYLVDGYLVCEWTRDPRIGVNVWEPFIHCLADRVGAVIMNQYGGIVYPDEAKAAYELSTRHNQERT